MDYRAKFDQLVTEVKDAGTLMIEGDIKRSAKALRRAANIADELADYQTALYVALKAEKSDKHKTSSVAR